MRKTIQKKTGLQSKILWGQEGKRRGRESIKRLSIEEEADIL